MTTSAMRLRRESAVPPVSTTPLVDHAAVRQQLQRLLAGPSFRSSQRCQRFLLHVVEQSLTPDAEPLKERTIGIQVFGRDPGYDTAADPIVRVVAGDIRRRLGQYYADPAHQREPRIDLLAGGYSPICSWPAADVHALTATPAEPPSPVITLVPVPASAVAPDCAAGPGASSTAVPAWASPDRAASRWSRRRLFAVALLGLVAVAGVISARRTPSTTFDRFWSPLFGSKVPVLVCTGSIEVYQVSGRVKEAAKAKTTATIDGSDVERVGAGFVSVADAVSLVRLAALFERHGTPYQVRETTVTSFDDLRTAPTVLVGMFSNAWTLQLGSEFRFVPVMESSGHILIRDRQHPEERAWQLDRPWPALTVTRDYALVSRVLDQATGTMVVMGAGITPYGTTAAAEFLTSRSYLEMALARAPADWASRNLQIVLETRVIDGVAGPPRVLATHVW